MIELICEHCGSPFCVKPYRAAGIKKARFCSLKCKSLALPVPAPFLAKERPWLKGNRHAAGQPPNATSFKKGDDPWNKDLKGIHLSPSTEFKPGPRPERQAPIGTVTIRRDQQGHDRAWVKIGQPNKWKLRAVLEWEKVNGPVPNGHVIHHCDRDALNDSPTNLQNLTRSEHAKEHYEEFASARRS